MTNMIIAIFILRGYICKKPDHNQPKLPTATCPITQLCEAGWLPWGTSCYKLSASNIAVTVRKQ